MTIIESFSHSQQSSSALPQPPALIQNEVVKKIQKIAASQRNSKVHGKPKALFQGAQVQIVYLTYVEDSQSFKNIGEDRAQNEVIRITREADLCRPILRVLVCKILKITLTTLDWFLERTISLRQLVLANNHTILSTQNTIRSWKFEDQPYTYDLVPIHHRRPRIDQILANLERRSNQNNRTTDWSEIPPEIWETDPFLPFQIQKLLKKMGVSAPMKPFLVDVLKEGSNALIYSLLQLNEKNRLNAFLFQLIIESPNPKKTATVCLEEYSLPVALNPSVMVAASESSAFNVSLEKVERQLKLRKGKSLEERIHRLPNKPYKLLFLSLAQMLITQEPLTASLLNFIERHPYIECLNAVFNALNYAEEGNFQHIAPFFAAIEPLRFLSNSATEFPILEHLASLLSQYKNGHLVIKDLLNIARDSSIKNCSDKYNLICWALYAAFKQNSKDVFPFIISIDLNDWIKQLMQEDLSQPIVGSFKSKFKSMTPKFYQSIFSKHRSDCSLNHLLDPLIELIKEDPKLEYDWLCGNFHASNVSSDTKDTFKELIKLAQKDKKLRTDINRIMKLPKRLKRIANHVGKDYFGNMLDLDRKYASGKFLSKYFNKGISAYIDSGDSAAVDIIEMLQGRCRGLRHFSIEYYKKWQKQYLSSFEKFYDQGYLVNCLASNDDCLQALSHLKNKTSSFYLKVLSLATHTMLEKLAILLKWMAHHPNRPEAEGLLDMAQAGYLTEVADLLNRLAKDPTNEDLNFLLKIADSIAAPHLQKALMDPSVLARRSLEAPSQVPSFQSLSNLETIEARMTLFSRQTFKNQNHKKRAIQTELSIVLAQAMITPDGEILMPTQDQIEKLLEKLNISLDCEYATHVKCVLSEFTKNPKLSTRLKRMTMHDDKTRPAGQIVCGMLRIPDNQPLSPWHAQVASLSARLSTIRQGSIGSCNGTAWADINQDYIEKGLEDDESILLFNGLNRSLPGKHKGTRFFPIDVPVEKLKRTVINDNLLLKARENIFNNMNGYSTIKYRKHPSGIIVEQLKLFEEENFFDREIVTYNKLYKYDSPISKTCILEAQREAFDSLVTPLYNFTTRHPAYHERGWFNLFRQDTQTSIQTESEWRSLHIDAAKIAFETLRKKHLNQQDYLSKLLNYLEHSITNLLPSTMPEWLRSVEHSKGDIFAIMAIDLGYEQFDIPMFGFKPFHIDDVITQLCQFSQTLSKREKGIFTNEPHRKYPLRVYDHDFSFIPAAFLNAIANGHTGNDICNSLRKQPKIPMTEITLEKREEWLKTWKQWDSKPKQARQIQLMIDHLDWNKISWEDLAHTTRHIQRSVYEGQLFSLAQQRAWINILFNLLTPAQKKEIPTLTIADTNWMSPEGDNVYLIFAHCPLTNQPQAFLANKNRSIFYLYKNKLLDHYWHLPQPSSLHNLYRFK